MAGHVTARIGAPSPVYYDCAPNGDSFARSAPEPDCGSSPASQAALTHAPPDAVSQQPRSHSSGW